MTGCGDRQNTTYHFSLSLRGLKLTLPIVVFLLASGCSKKEPSPLPDPGYDYYPMQKGNYSVFEADSVVYTEIPRDTLHYRYRIKEILSDSFTDETGTVVWRLERFIKMYHPGKTYDSLPWTVKDVWMVNGNKRRVEVVEENRRLTKLAFPVRAGSGWNGSPASDAGETDCYYEYVDRAAQVGTLAYDRTLKVNRKDLRTLISYDYRSETYAHGVGLVCKEYTELYSNNIVPQQAVEQRIEKGVVYTQTLIASGHE